MPRLLPSLGVSMGLMAVTAATQTASAQDRFDPQHFQLMPSQNHNYLSVASGSTLDAGDWEVGLLGNLARDELVFSAENFSGSILKYRTRLDTYFTVGIFRSLDLGINLPFYVQQNGDVIPALVDFDEPDGGAGIADPRAVLKVSLFDKRRFKDKPGGFALALLADTYLPLARWIGNNELYQGDGFRIHPRLAVDFGTKNGKHLFAFNAGYMVRPDKQILNLDVDDLVTAGIAADFQLAEMFHLVPEFRAGMSPLAPSVEQVESPLTGRLAARFIVTEGLMIQAGGTMGIVQGYGAPQWRVFAGIHYGRDPQGADKDDDGIPNRDDACPDVAEDMDGFRDADGCPDLDNDGDGIADNLDICPDQPETVNGVDDADGCPDVAEAPEPEPDPCEEPELHGKVYFKSNSATLAAGSSEVLDDLAAQLAAKPAVLKVEIEGHTDSTGPEWYNTRLSSRRAAAVVEYLVAQGVAADRLTSVGKGETEPVDDNTTATGRANNRRVEIDILEAEPCGD